jgi:hypothetical protein
LRPAEAAELALAAVVLLLAVRLTCLDYLERKGGKRLSGFTAVSVVEPLNFDFSPFTAASGTIREPTDRQIGDFLTGVKRITKAVQQQTPKTVDDGDPAALLDALDDLDPETVVTLMHDMADVYAELCGGNPSAQQILELPLRVRQAFFGWLQQEVMAPEAAPGGGRAQVTPLRSKAAG